MELGSKRQRRTYVRQIHHITSYLANIPPKYSEVPITFGSEDAKGLFFTHPLVISASITNFKVKCVLIDGGKLC